MKFTVHVAAFIHTSADVTIEGDDIQVTLTRDVKLNDSCLAQPASLKDCDEELEFLKQGDAATMLVAHSLYLALEGARQFTAKVMKQMDSQPNRAVVSQPAPVGKPN